MWLYSVWRNSDDQLVVLDGTVDQCCEMMGISKQYFFHISNDRLKKTNTFTIKRIRASELESEVDE